jgi:3-hydroxyisobutyrate dehydrogenase
MDVGFCGLGDMGAAMAARLLDKGHRVTVWNRTAAKAKPLLDQGATWAASPAEVATRNGIVITSLFDDKAITDVFDGPDGLLAPDCRGKLFIETSTVHAETTLEMAAGAQARGAILLECPVAGGPPMARDGKLMGLVGGAVADLVRARPLLDDLCQRLDHFGPLGAGNAVKLAINLPLVVYFEALGEALALVRDVPVDPQLIIAVLSESPGGANVMKFAGPWIAEALTSGREAGGLLPLAAARKDLHLMLDAAQRVGAALPVTSATLQSYEDAVADGWGARPFWTLSLYRRGKVENGDATQPAGRE